MRCQYVRRTISDVDVPSIGLPPWNVSSKFIVGKNNVAIMLLLERILERLGIGATSIPKLVYEDIPFLIGTKLQEWQRSSGAMMYAAERGLLVRVLTRWTQRRSKGEASEI
jgi:hypothetical protein